MLSIVKSFTFTANILCLLCGIVCVIVNFKGLELALPNTPEHTFFLVGIVLAFMSALFTILGIYGVICDSLSISIMYSLLLLILLTIQLSQIFSIQLQISLNESVSQIYNYLHIILKQPQLMQKIEQKLDCCGFNGIHNYPNKNLTLPNSCYSRQHVVVDCLIALQNVYVDRERRQLLCQYCSVLVQTFALISTIIFCSLLYKRPYRQSDLMEPVQHCTQPRMNHVDSRTHLLSIE